MRTLFRQFGAMAWMTVVQELRQPVLLLVTISSGTAVMLLPVLIAHQFGEDGKLVRDSALALYFFFGLPFSVFAADTLRRERTDGTAAATLSKAVRPEVFFMAKYTGTAILTVGYALAMSAAVLLADRIAPRLYLADLRMYRVVAALVVAGLVAAGLWNLLTRRSFCAAAWVGWVAALVTAVLIATRIEGAVDAGLTFARPIQWRIVPAAIMIAAALLVFTALAAALSAYLKPVQAVAVCFLVLVLGLLSEYMFGRFADSSYMARVAYAVAPNWQHFWSADWLTGGGTVPAALLRQALAYAALYTTGILALGAALWRHTEIR